MDIYKAARIFDPRNWPSEPNDLVVYGWPELQVLCRHFDVLLNSFNPPVDRNEVIQQWSEMKLLVNASNVLKKPSTKFFVQENF